MKKKFSMVIIIIIAWYLLATLTNRSMILPYPSDVAKKMLEQLQLSIFYKSISVTLMRSLCSFGIAFFTSLVCAILTYEFKIWKEILSPFLLLTRSVPNIAYIIVFLVWFGSETTAAFVGVLILFPMMYANFYQALLHMRDEYLVVLKLYPESFFVTVKKVYLPMLVPAMLASMDSGIGLSLKVGVMAEIIGQVSTGIGRQLNLCRIDLDMSGIFAWTIWIIIVLAIIEKSIAFIRQHRKE